MPMKIRVLDEHTINKIAAGEVIENTASVVKELVENSLDAGATDICVEIRAGGRQLIRITDNGCGMDTDDALLCLERHATSKIRQVDDIHSIDTMGFRGEAIPSIASISKFTLLTRPIETATTGTMVIVDGGKVIQCCSAACSPGTTIEVKSLFFNVPVRKKFQRSPIYDANEVLKVLSSLALGYPHIQFQLISDQKNVFSTKNCMSEEFSDQLGQRIKDILGIEFLESMSALQGNLEGYAVRGYIGLPTNTRPNRMGQYLFINQRAVTSALINFAVREGYGTALPSGRHPIFVLHVTIPGELVDVNVHPQKREVRLRQEQELKEMLMKAVSEALQGKTIAYEPMPEERKETFLPQPQFETKSFPAYSLPTFTLPEMPKPILIAKNNEPTELPLETTPQRIIPRVLTTLKHYILIEAWKTPEGLCVVDQKAAHARVIFEKLALQQQEIPAQGLLIPYVFEATAFESALLIENLEELNKLGISIYQSGPQRFLVDALPVCFGNTDVQQLIVAMVEKMRDYHDKEALRREQIKQLAMAASRASISHRTRLSLFEAQALIDQLLRCQQPYHCPMGMPTMITVTYDELEKKFLT